MIETLEIKNYKNIKEVKLRIRPVTILIGPNGSGKSNIIQSLILLKQSKNSNELIIKGKYRDFITIEDISFFKDINKRIKFIIQGKKLFPTSSEEKSSDFEELRYSIVNTFDKGILENQTININMDLSKRSLKYSLKLHQESNIPFLEGKEIVIRNLGEVGGNCYIRFKGIHFEKLSKLEKDLILRLETIKEELGQIFFIPSIRGISFSSSPLTESTSEEFFSSDTIIQQNEDLLGTLGYKPEITDKISSWTERITGVPIKSRVIPNKQVIIQSSEEIPINITHEGFGLNQLIFLLTQLYLVPKESILTIEEPEAHLHPKAQAELIDVLHQNIIDKKLKIIIATHSEHVLLGFLSKVAKKELKYSDIAVYYCEKTPEGTKINQRDIDSEGRIEGGMPGFFEHNLDELQDFLNNLKKSIASKEPKE